jgi:TolA-binding protein
MSNRSPSPDQVHNDLKKLEAKVDEMVSVQSDMRDNILILTENQKEIKRLHETQAEQGRSIQDMNLRLTLTEAATANHKEKLKGVSESKLVNRAVIFIAGVIATGLIGLVFKVAFQWLTQS